MRGLPGHKGWRTLAYVLSLGAVTWAFSEPFFWARLEGEGNDPGEAAVTWTLYCAVVYLSLVALRGFRVNRVRSLFLVGAIVGWLIEGLVVPEVYLGLPFSIAWTALAWHAVLTVCVGWWLLPRLLRHGGTWSWVSCALLGGLWGLWSLDPVLDEEVPTLHGAGFVALANGVAVVLAAAYVGVERFRPMPGRLAPGVAAVVVGGLLAVWGAIVTFAPVFFALPMLAVLLGLVFWALRRLRPPAGGKDLISEPGFGVPMRRTPPLAIAGIAASVSHLGAGRLQDPVPMVVITATVLTAAGIGLLGWALISALRTRPGATAPLTGKPA